MSCGFVGIIAERTFLDVHTGEEEQLLLQGGDILFLELTHENLRCPTGVATVLAPVFDLGEPRVELFPADVQTAAESCRVPVFPHLAHGHRDLIDRLVEHQ